MSSFNSSELTTEIVSGSNEKALDELISSDCDTKKVLLSDLRSFTLRCIDGMAQSVIMVFLEGSSI